MESATALASQGAAIGWADLLRIAGALALVAPLAYLAARWVGRRSVPGAGASSRRMRALEVLPLGAGRALYLVSVGQRVLVLGVSPQHIDHLDTIDRPEEVAQLQQPPTGGHAGPRPGLASVSYLWQGRTLPAVPPRRAPHAAPESQRDGLLR